MTILCLLVMHNGASSHCSSSCANGEYYQEEEILHPISDLLQKVLTETATLSLKSVRPISKSSMKVGLALAGHLHLCLLGFHLIFEASSLTSIDTISEFHNETILILTSVCVSQ